MTNENKPEKDEVPHRDLQIEYHKDWIKYLQGIAGKPVWQELHGGEWADFPDGRIPSWVENCAYRRKPMVKKIVVADWFVQSNLGDISRYRCESAEKLRSLFPYANTIQKIDNTEIEIEVEE